MKKHIMIYLLTLPIILGACSSLEKKAAAPTHKPLANSSNTQSLQNLSNRSLYLAAQSASHNGQQALAVQLLTTLVVRLDASDDPQDTFAIPPRLQLAGLFLGNNQAPQALKHLEPLKQHMPIAKDNSTTQQNLHLMYARALAGTGKLNDALDYLTLLLNQHPDFTPARHLQITLFVQTQQLELAHIAINTAIKLQDTPQLRQLQADTYLLESKPEKAINSLQKMQALIPEDETPILLQSNIEIQRNHLIKAEKILRQFIKTNPSALRVRNALARLLIQLKRGDEAIKIYKQLQQDMPGQSEIISAIGLLYYQQKQFEKATEKFTQALQLNPKQQSHRFYLAASLEALQKSKRARALYKQIDNDHPLWKQAQLRLVRMDIVSEQLRAANKRIHKVLEQSPYNIQAWELLSMVYLTQKKYQKLLDETETVITRKTVSTRLLLNRAIAFEHFKRYDEASDALNTLIKITPDDSEALNFLGYLYAVQGIKLDQAEHYIQQALSKKPNDGYYLDSLAWVYYKRGDYSKAIATQKKALKHTQDDPVMHEHLGDMYWKSGEHENAIQQWRQALTLTPDNASILHHKIKNGL